MTCRAVVVFVFLVCHPVGICFLSLPLSVFGCSTNRLVILNVLIFATVSSSQGMGTQQEGNFDLEELLDLG
jgi:hypothetical protein